jgi:uncharacterized protein YutE (UPF0331/DUF86 family)
MTVLPALRLLRSEGLVDTKLADEIDNLRELRNQIVHDRINIDKTLTTELLRRLDDIVLRFEKEISDALCKCQVPPGIL